MEHHVIWYTGAIDSISWFLYHCTWPHILYRNLLQHRCNNNVYRAPEYFTTNFRTSCFTRYIFLGLANELFRMWHLCVALFHKKSCTLQHVFFTRYQQCSLHLTSEVCGYLDCVYSSLLMSHGKVECKRILKFRQ
jgi:hypothetical protein